VEQDQTKKHIILILKPLTSYCICACQILFINSVLQLMTPTDDAADAKEYSTFHFSTGKWDFLHLSTIVFFKKRK